MGREMAERGAGVASMLFYCVPYFHADWSFVFDKYSFYSVKRRVGGCGLIGAIRVVVCIV